MFHFKEKRKLKLFMFVFSRYINPHIWIQHSDANCWSSNDKLI